MVYYSIGLMRSGRGLSVQYHYGRRAGSVIEKDRVKVFFRTGLRDASTEAARGAEYLHQHD